MKQNIMRLNTKECFYSGILMAISMLIGVLIIEFLCHFVLEPIDYLMPVIENDPVLGVKIRPYSAGHDAWGYRNPSVPESSNIVAIGDSQTYGVSAVAQYSWPAWLQLNLSKSVYNLSLGGYDSVDYAYLLENKALQLNPELVIVGFYFGNDLSEAYRKVYSRPYWKDLRNPSFSPPEKILFKNTDTIHEQSDKTRVFGGLRRWLARNSFLYRIATTYLSEYIKALKYRKDKNTQSMFSILEEKEKGLFTAFKPKIRLGALNIDDDRIKEGLRISLDAIYRMNKICEDRGIKFVVLLIPTKERVYAGMIEENENLSHIDDINDLLKHERIVDARVKEALVARDIPYIDVLMQLQEAAIEGKKIYPVFDGHPNMDGYKIIAEVVTRQLKGLNLIRNDDADSH